MTRKPAFWIVLALLGVAGSVTAFKLFPLAFPILSVDIRMSRDQALAQARERTRESRWTADPSREAASFSHLNPAFQTYMELEGGGLEELNRLVRENTFSIYAWRVRHFTPGEVLEAEIRFTPQGRPYGFRLRLPEDQPGDTLDSEAARELALSRAREDWGVDTSLYELLESSQEEKPGGRIDHTFVFERQDLVLGDARIRLRLLVAGNRLAELTHILHVPEAFLRRYQDTRNANETISLAGTVVFLLLFLTLGGGIGAVHLLRHRTYEWKAPMLWGGVVAGLMALGSLNSLPLSWMSYDTALPAQVHVATVALTATLTFLAGGVFLGLIFTVGEGLMRLGFPGQIQQWRLWSPGVANSTPALGRTVAPYLIVGIELGFVVTFYLVMSRWAGWWSPAGAMAEPDLLATYFPWLTAVSTSLFAAFSEETIFRAIPIGAAAFLGRRYGKPWVWIWSAVVLQALVFGASHANYPQQPAYARVVEIFPTFLAWGVITVYFGLVPAIIGHFTYNLVFFSLPLFAAETQGVWADRAIIIAAGVLPLAVVFLSRLRRGAVSECPEWARNRSWTSPASLEESEEPAEEGEGDGSGLRTHPQDFHRLEAGGVAYQAPKPLSRRTLALALVAGVAGLILWAVDLDPPAAPRLSLDRPAAESSARDLLDQEKGVILDSEWKAFPSVLAGKGLDHRFVWEKASPEEYHRLVGTFLSQPLWRVRFLNFQAEPAERAESFVVYLSPRGNLERLRHVLPEGRPGASLTEEEAREVAVTALETRLDVSTETVREISAEETAHPNRTDWTFTFRAMEGYPLSVGEGRREIRIAGREVADARSFVHVPEDWEREWRADQSRRTLVFISIAGVLALLSLGAAILAVVKWSRKTLDTSWLRPLTGISLALLLLQAGNGWPGTQASFTTQLSFGNQVGITLVGIVLGITLMALGLGLLGALAHTWLGDEPRSGTPGLWVGLALGALVIGVSRILPEFGPGGPPSWPAYGGAVAFLPWASTALETLVGFLVLTVAGLLVVATLQRLLGTRWSWTTMIVLLLIGLSLAPNPPGQSWWLWMLEGGVVGAVTGLFWLACRRLGWAVIPGAAGAVFFLGAAQTGLQQPFPGATFGALLGVMGVALAARVWTRALLP